jgi:hypothetical protein
MGDLILKHAAGTRADDYDVIVDGQVVGYIMLSDAAPADTPWIWTLEQISLGLNRRDSQRPANEGVSCP